MVALPGEARFPDQPDGLNLSLSTFSAYYRQKTARTGRRFSPPASFSGRYEGLVRSVVEKHTDFLDFSHRSVNDVYICHTLSLSPASASAPPRRHHAGQQPHLRSARLAATTAATENATSGHRKNRHRFRAPRRRLRQKADRRPALRPPTVGYLRATPFRSSARRHPFLHRQTSPCRRFRFHPPAKQRRPPPTEPSSRPRRTSAS